jgi:hypothetical protein
MDLIVAARSRAWWCVNKLTIFLLLLSSKVKLLMEIKSNYADGFENADD